MIVIGIESSSLVASAAILRDDVLVAEYTVNYKKTHSQTLLPMIDEIVRMTELDLAQIDGIAVAEGPGSFTGLRIGAATAKGIGLALEKPIAAVPTVDAMAYQLYGCAHRICPIMDAKRQQVYTGIYRFTEKFEVLKPACAMPAEELAGELLEQDGKVVFLGDGVPVFREFLQEKMGERALFAPAPAARQRAGAVAALGMEYLKAGRTVSADDFAPNYHRISQAERERARRLAAERSSAGRSVEHERDGRPAEDRTPHA